MSIEQPIRCPAHSPCLTDATLAWPGALCLVVAGHAHSISRTIFAAALLWGPVGAQCHPPWTQLHPLPPLAPAAALSVLPGHRQPLLLPPWAWLVLCTSSPAPWGGGSRGREAEGPWHRHVLVPGVRVMWQPRAPGEGGFCRPRSLRRACSERDFRATLRRKI